MLSVRVSPFTSYRPITKAPDNSRSSYTEGGGGDSCSCEYLERVAASVQEHGITVQVITIQGRPHFQILQYAETNQVDMIVMCSRGQSGLSRWMIGSVADRVMRGANVPVQLVRAQKKET